MNVVPGPVKKQFDLRHNNVTNFITRYWKLHVGFVIFMILVLVPGPFDVFGTLLYLPLLSISAVLVSLAVRHSFFLKTLDHDAYSGFFVDEWQKLDARTRIYLNLGFLAVLILSISIIASAMIR